MSETSPKYLSISEDDAVKIVADMREAAQISRGKELQVVYQMLKAHEEKHVTYCQLMFLKRLFALLNNSEYTYKYDTFASNLDHIVLSKKEKREKVISPELRKALLHFIRETTVTIVQNDATYRLLENSHQRTVFEPVSKAKTEANTNDIQLHVAQCFNKIERILPLHAESIKVLSVTINNTTVPLKSCKLPEYGAFCGQMMSDANASLLGMDDKMLKLMIQVMPEMQQMSVDEIESAQATVLKLLKKTRFSTNDFLFLKAVLPHIIETNHVREIIPSFENKESKSDKFNALFSIGKFVITGLQQLLRYDSKKTTSEAKLVPEEIPVHIIEKKILAETVSHITPEIVQVHQEPLREVLEVTPLHTNDADVASTEKFTILEETQIIQNNNVLEAELPSQDEEELGHDSLPTEENPTPEIIPATIEDIAVITHTFSNQNNISIEQYVAWNKATKFFGEISICNETK